MENDNREELVSNGVITTKEDCTEKSEISNKCAIHRQRSCHGPRPVTQFGPKAQLTYEQPITNRMSKIRDPSNMILEWKTSPQNVLIICKSGDSELLGGFIELACWLIKEMGLTLYIESCLYHSEIKNNLNIQSVINHINNWSQDCSESDIDFIISLGGDGTLLHAASLFQLNCPPVIAYHMGSLGFLTSFKFSNFKEDLTTIIKGRAKLILRKRLDCMIISSEKDIDEDWNANNMGYSRSSTVLNEVVIDRGIAPHLCYLDVYCNDCHITSIQGDGLIISTPTGSTAYAAAAGASMVHPSVPGILITPVCAHALSSRPVIVPAGVELKIMLSDESRSSAFASFDGKNRQEIKSGEGILVTTSIYAVPCLTKDDQINDWFTTLGECFQWNVRKRKKHC